MKIAVLAVGSVVFGLLGGVALGGAAVRLAEVFMRETAPVAAYAITMLMTGLSGVVFTPMAASLLFEEREP